MNSFSWEAFLNKTKEDFIENLGRGIIIRFNESAISLIEIEILQS